MELFKESNTKRFILFLFLGDFIFFPDQEKSIYPKKEHHPKVESPPTRGPFFGF